MGSHEHLEPTDAHGHIPDAYHPHGDVLPSGMVGIRTFEQSHDPSDIVPAILDANGDVRPFVEELLRDKHEVVVETGGSNRIAVFFHSAENFVAVHKKGLLKLAIPVIVAGITTSATVYYKQHKKGRR